MEGFGHNRPSIGYLAPLTAHQLGGGNAGLRNRANRVALRMLELIRAFGAGFSINDVGLVLERNRRRGAFKFASAANGALGSDDLIGHGSDP